MPTKKAVVPVPPPIPETPPPPQQIVGLSQVIQTRLQSQLFGLTVAD